MLGRRTFLKFLGAAGASAGVLKSGAVDGYGNRAIDRVPVKAPLDTSLATGRTMYVGLFLKNGKEIEAPSYTRAQMKFIYDFGEHRFVNIDEGIFPYPTENWGKVVGLGIFDQQEGGGLLFKGFLNTQKEIVANDPPPRFARGDCEVKIR